MKLTSQEKNAMETLRNISGYSIETISNVLKALMYYTLMNYSEGENTLVPYFGRFAITYKGDEYTPSGRIAKLDSVFFPSSHLKLNVGVFEDIKEQNGDITEIPCIKDIIRDINLSLKISLNEDNLKQKENS